MIWVTCISSTAQVYALELHGSCGFADRYNSYVYVPEAGQEDGRSCLCHAGPSTVDAHTYMYISIHPPMIHMRLCCYIVKTVFCMQLCLMRNPKHCNTQCFLLFGLYSNCISCVLALSLRAQKLKTDSVFKIMCLPYAHTYTIYIHTCGNTEIC